MQRKNYFYVNAFLVLLGSLLFGQGNIFAQEEVVFPENARQLMDWEFNHNSSNNPAKRKPQNFEMEYFAIPAELVDIQKSSTTPAPILNTLFFEQDGKPFVRWPINPEDTKFHVEMATYLQAQGASAERFKLGPAKLSSSRSMMVKDPASSYVFFLKVSTNKTGGDWQDKKVNSNQTIKSRISSELGDQANADGRFSTLKLWDEPVSMVVDSSKKNPTGIDHGIVVRSVDELNKSDNYYLPGFTAIHEVEGARIASVNGEEDPALFWMEHYSRPLGLASAEMAAYMGLTYESAHSQQYMIELDHSLRPTGKIVFRDFNDSDALVPFFHNPDKADFLQKWLPEWRKQNMDLRFGIFHGSVVPSWIEMHKHPRRWIEAYFNSFHQRFSEITKIPLAELRPTVFPNYYVPYSRSLGYYSKIFGAHGTHWDDFLTISECMQGKDKMGNGLVCEDVLDCFKTGKDLSRNGVACFKIMGLIHEKDESKVAAALVPTPKPSPAAADTAAATTATAQDPLLSPVSGSDSTPGPADPLVDSGALSDSVSSLVVNISIPVAQVPAQDCNSLLVSTRNVAPTPAHIAIPKQNDFDIATMAITDFSQSVFPLFDLKKLRDDVFATLWGFLPFSK